MITNSGGYCGVEIRSSGAAWLRDMAVMNFVYGVRIEPTAG